MFHVFPPPLLFRGPLPANHSIIFRWACPTNHLVFAASVTYRFSSDPNPRNVQCPLGQSFGLFGNTWRITFTILFIVLGKKSMSLYIAMKMKRSLKSFGRAMNSFCIMCWTSRRSVNVVWSGKIFTFFMRTNFFGPNDQTVLLSVESSGKRSLWNRRSRQRWTCGCEKWKTQQWRMRTIHDAREWKKVKKTHTPDMSWTHTRWNIECTKCAVRTSRRLQRNRCCLWTKTWKNIVLNAPSFRRSRHCGSAILQNSGKLHSLLLQSCSWPPLIGRWRSWSGKLPPIDPTWTLIDKARNKILRAWCMLIGWTSCGMTCENFIMLLDLLPLALSDLKIGSNSDTALVSNFNCVLLFFQKKTMIVEKSAPDWIGAVAFPWLSSTLPRIALFPTVC